MATSNNTIASPMSYRNGLKRSSAQYATALQANADADTTKKRRAERQPGARRSPNVQRQWPTNETTSATSQPTMLASTGAMPMRSTAHTATAQCTAAAIAPTTVKAIGLPRTQGLVVIRGSR